MTLEQELVESFASTAGQRNREILAAYHGWLDGRPRTLTEVGRQFGITRERVRQVCAKLTKPPRTAAVETPTMELALALIAARLPAPAAEIEAELLHSGLTTVGLSLEAVAAGARLLDRQADFQVVEIDAARLAVAAGHERQVAAIADAAKKEVYFHGLTTVERVAKLVSDGMKRTGSRGKQRGAIGKSKHKVNKAALTPLVRRTVAMLEGFCWLDETKGWFYFSSIQRHGLPKAIDKVLSVAGELGVGQLRGALMRNRRLWRQPPPPDVLLEYCRRMPDVRIENRKIISDPPRDWRRSLAGVEAQLVAALKTHGPIMERGEMEDLCVAGGMNRFSFHAFVSWSPVIVQLGHSIYGLLGTKVSRREAREYMARCRESHAPRRVLDNHGWTDDGKIRLCYRLSKAASTYAVITIPAALKSTIGGRFQILDPAGRPIGTLATKDGRAWGLGAYLRKNGAHSGDLITLTLDLHERIAAIDWEAAES